MRVGVVEAVDATPIRFFITSFVVINSFTTIWSFIMFATRLQLFIVFTTMSCTLSSRSFRRSIHDVVHDAVHAPCKTVRHDGVIARDDNEVDEEADGEEAMGPLRSVEGRRGEYLPPPTLVISIGFH